jgi:hypothetical protein
MSAAMTAELVTDALVMAIWRRGRPRELLHHSDSGSQYTSEAFQRLLAEHGVTCSLSRSGNVWDNAAMESFFSSLKIERVARKVYRTRNQARADVFDYIERFYNPRRRHSTIGYLSPIQFEQKARLACRTSSSSLWLVRSQETVSDVSYMSAMIPHYSIAIMISTRGHIRDPRVRKLADGIIEAQEREIREMKELIADLKAKPVPGNARDLPPRGRIGTLMDRTSRLLNLALG